MKLSCSSQNQSQICHFCFKNIFCDSTNLYPYDFRVHANCLRNLIRKTMQKVIQCPVVNCNHQIEFSSWLVANNIYTVDEYIKMNGKIVDNRKLLTTSINRNIANLCNICNENVDEKNQLFYFPKCGHTYHCNCIKHSVAQSKKKDLCCPNINQSCQNILRINKNLVDYGVLTDLEFHYISTDLRKNNSRKISLERHITNTNEEIDNSIDVEALRRTYTPISQNRISRSSGIQANKSVDQSKSSIDRPKDTNTLDSSLSNHFGDKEFASYRNILEKNYCKCTSGALKNPFQMTCCGILHDKMCIRKHIISQRSLYFRCMACNQVLYVDGYYIEKGVLTIQEVTKLRDYMYQVGKNDTLCCLCNNTIYAKDCPYYKICSRSHKIHAKCFATFKKDCLSKKVDRIKCPQKNCDEILSLEKYKEECIICRTKFFKDSSLLQPYLVASTKYSYDVIEHQNNYLVVCPHCENSMCKLCRTSPYHIGQVCAEFKNYPDKLFIQKDSKISVK